MASNKVAVVTGASSGIGYATAIEFARQGYNVVLAARRKAELDKVAAECEAIGSAALVVMADTSKENEVTGILQQALNRFGHIDVWVNNAAVYMFSKILDAPLKDVQRVMDVNFYGYVYGSRAAVAQFKQQGYGTLINIGSVNATAAQPYVGIYSASKAAVRAFTDSLRMELRLDGMHEDIHICTAMPAMTDTNLFQNAANYTGHSLQGARPVSDPEHVAKRVVRLASHPKREIIIGPAGRFLQLEKTHMPRVYERSIASYTEDDMLDEDVKEPTAGNLYKPIHKHTGMRGGWREDRLRADHFNVGLGLAVLGIAGLSAMFLRKSHKR